MSFYEEPDGYAKTALSDLQGAWSNLRMEVADRKPFTEQGKLLFHIDEAMSWESVRNLNHMKDTLLLITNLANQAKVPDKVMEWINIANDAFDETMDALSKGEIQ